MSARKEFVLLACQEGANIRALCRQFEPKARAIELRKVQDKRSRKTKHY
ncbi:hypothetical protein [Methylovulum psychrotolerans]|nr:hypothetical protein [Methylovulum psychrotolerans]